MTIRIALAQVTSTDDLCENLATIDEYTSRAAADGARLVVFPEAMMRCFGGASLVEIAQPLDGPWANAVRAIAAQAGVAIATGMFTPTDDGRVRNTLLVTGAGVDAHYDKIHLFDAFGFAESDTVAPGLLRPTIPWAIPDDVRQRCTAARHLGVVGCGPWQGRALGTPRPRPCSRHNDLRRGV
jgi:predicted amidohydrolase